MVGLSTLAVNQSGEIGGAATRLSKLQSTLDYLCTKIHYVRYRTLSIVTSSSPEDGADFGRSAGDTTLPLGDS